MLVISQIHQEAYEHPLPKYFQPVLPYKRKIKDRVIYILVKFHPEYPDTKESNVLTVIFCCTFILEVLSVGVIDALCRCGGRLLCSRPLMFDPFVGPVSSILVNKYGSRPVMIIGGCLSGSGLIAASFSNSVEGLYFCIGVIGGELLLIHF